MAILRDPEERETAALLDFAGDLTGKQVLEIGSGDGRLTWRYAAQAATVEGIDPDAEKVALANASVPAGLEGRVRFFAAGLEEFAAGPGRHGAYDLAILAWSL